MGYKMTTPKSRKPKSPPKPKPVFDWRARALEATRLLHAPAPHDWVDRPVDMRRTVVARFCLPLEMCPTTNSTSRAIPGWAHAKRKQAVWSLMQLQDLAIWGPAYVDGILTDTLCNARGENVDDARPQILAIRFACGSCDASSNFAKAAIDNLRTEATFYVSQGSKRIAKKSPRLDYIVDDSPQYAQVRQWWEPVEHKNQECVYIEVRV
jgi:hypothetical protein